MPEFLKNRSGLFSALLLFLAILNLTGQNAKNHSVYVTSDLNIVSEQFLKKIKEGKSAVAIKQKLASISVENLQNSLDTDTKKKAFWINIYNAFIQDILTKHPELYEDRGDFFSRDQITIAGTQISFDKIEHGILRRSQSKLGFGYVGKLFTNRLERDLRVSKIDYRIHFALNCGAKDCPPVAIYTPERLEKQLEKATANFLKSSSYYDEKTSTASVTSLFSWFRGDFGGIDEVKKILNEQGLIPENKKVGLKFRDYDWTLYLNNFIDL